MAIYKRFGMDYWPMNADIETTIKGGLAVRAVLRDEDVFVMWPQCHCEHVNCRHTIHFPIPLSDEQKIMALLLDEVERIEYNGN